MFGMSVITFGQVDYNTEIQLILNDNCTNCHGSAGGLNLSNYMNLMNGGNNGLVITPYDHTTSELYIRITLPSSSDEDMPPQGSLSQDDIDLIAAWIDEGALEEPVSSSGCTDPEAYNCADDIWEDGNEYPNYFFEVGVTVYPNGCNYDTDDYLNIIYVGGCENGPCEGYYNPGATADDGSCDYWQAPHGDDVEFTEVDGSISLDWSLWENVAAPQNADIIGYNIQRCYSICDFITGMPFPDFPNNTNYIIDPFITDDWDWQTDLAYCSEFANEADCNITDGCIWNSSNNECHGHVKYAINVKYSNAENYGEAIGASYITPGSCLCALGDNNCDGGWNVLDIVTLANCVLASNCAVLEFGCATDLNGDGNYNVLDIVTLANCVLAQNCGG